MMISAQGANDSASTNKAAPKLFLTTEHTEHTEEENNNNSV